jgi:hypothetical protein
MGCDIHLFTERKRCINSKDAWVNIDNRKPNPYFKEGNEYGESMYSLNSAYRTRNYNLFSMLADVRNRSGNKYIADPKGLPEDVSSVVKKESDSWASDGHSHSFFTMKELYDFQAENTTQKYSGLVDSEGSKEIDLGEMPDWWCGGSTQKDLVYREWTQENTTLNSFIQDLENHFKSEYYNKEEDAENFRIVFWFDN